MNIYVFEKDISIAKNDVLFNNHLDRELFKFSLEQPYCDMSDGFSITTCSDDRMFEIIDSKGYMKEWLQYTLIKYKKYLGQDYKGHECLRSWCNRTFNQCKVNPHDHGYMDIEEGYEIIVVILYYHVSGECNLTFCENDQLTDLQLSDGMSVIHDHDLTHFVSDDTSDVRTCFVFDIKMKL